MANLSIRVDDELKKQAETIFSQLGLNMSTAMTLFLKQAVRYGGIPFDLRVDTPFDSPENQLALRKSIANYNRDKEKLIKKTIEELEAMEND